MLNSQPLQKDLLNYMYDYQLHFIVRELSLIYNREFSNFDQSDCITP